MAKIVRDDIDNINMLLTITLEKTEIESKLSDELKKLRGKVQMKGFRKGKTPIGLVRKMYGKGVLLDISNNLLQTELNNYIKNENLKILGHPIASDDQAELDFDVNKVEDLTFKFDLGIAPEFTLDPVAFSTNATYDKYKVTVSDTVLEEELLEIRKRNGDRVDTDEQIEENDMLTINAEELEGDKVKEKGWATTFTVLVSTLEEDVKKQLLTNRKGDTFRFNIHKLEPNKDENHVRKYLLNVPENETQEIGEEFEGNISEVKRIRPAELNQELFDKHFGEGLVNSEAEARTKIAENIAGYFDRQAEQLVNKEMMDKIIDVHKIVVPEAFLRRWLLVANENVTAEQIDQEFEGFIKDLRWSLIRTKYVDQKEIKIEEEEMVEAFKDRIRGYFGGNADELVVLNTANKLLEDREQADKLYQELLNEKLFTSIKESVSINEKPIDMNEFQELLMKDHMAKLEQQVIENTAPAEGDDAVVEESVVEEEGEV